MAIMSGAREGRGAPTLDRPTEPGLVGKAYRARGRACNFCLGLAPSGPSGYAPLESFSTRKRTLNSAVPIEVMPEIDQRMFA